jgi:hypothetical protein
MASNSVSFYPPRRTGLLVNIGLIVALSGLVVSLFLLALGSALGPLFLLYLLLALFLAVPLPLVIYRFTSFVRGHYIVERDGVRLQWGLRVEDIPIDQIEWVRLADDLLIPLTPPRLRWPGAVVGATRHADAGRVEFLAASLENMVIIGTRKHVFAISPEDPQLFVDIYEEMLEQGSLAPLRPFSAYPDFLLADVWRARAAQALLVPAVVLNLALFIWVSLLIGAYQEIPLGFSAGGAPLDSVPSANLFLLPVVNLLLLLGAFALSLVFYRQRKDHPMTYILWSSSALTAGIFLAAVARILQAA